MSRQGVAELFEGSIGCFEGLRTPFDVFSHSHALGLHLCKTGCVLLELAVRNGKRARLLLRFFTLCTEEVLR